MKFKIFVLFILVNSQSFSQEIDYVKLIPGISTDDFRNLVPKVIPVSDAFSGKATEYYVYKETEGHWDYYYNQNILESAFFESYQYIDYYDRNEGKSISAQTKFKQFQKNTSAIFADLTLKYGEPTITKKDDTTNFLLNAASTDFVILTAEWKTDDYTVQFNSYYDGVNPNGRYQNNINAPVERYSLVMNIIFKGKETESKMHFRLGETAQEMEKRNALVFKNGTGFYGYYSLENNWKGLEGSWEFCFNGGKLKNAGFNYNYFERPKENPLTEKKYDSLISNFRGIKKELETNYGKPVSGLDEIPDYKKIEVHKVTGLDFLQYEWRTKKQVIQLSLRYHYGGKGEFYSSMYFDVKITDLEGNYSYCDR
jgi:hypothetical protein